MFSRTPSGIINEHLFYPGYYLVIVEGPSDLPFWSNFFPSEVNGYRRKIKQVGGKLAVQKYLEQLLLNNAKFAVAIDSDYRLILDDLHQHDRILETQYHSIENIMLSSFSIASIIRTLSCDLDYELTSADSWLKDFNSATHPLMIADIIIEKNNLGKKCVGDNCDRFLVGKNNPVFDLVKIDDFLKKLNLPEEEFNELEHKIKLLKPQFHIRGHFLLSAALSFVSHEVKKIRKSVSISNESFNGMLILLCKSRIHKEPMLQSIEQKALLAAKEVTYLLSQEN
jgi:Protein of unknown function (DUF4435)